MLMLLLLLSNCTNPWTIPFFTLVTEKISERLNFYENKQRASFSMHMNNTLLREIVVIFINKKIWKFKMKLLMVRLG